MFTNKVSRELFANVCSVQASTLVTQSMFLICLLDQTGVIKSWSANFSLSRSLLPGCSSSLLCPLPLQPSLQSCQFSSLQSSSLCVPAAFVRSLLIIFISQFVDALPIAGAYSPAVYLLVISARWYLFSWCGFDSVCLLTKCLVSSA